MMYIRLLLAVTIAMLMGCAVRSQPVPETSPYWAAAHGHDQYGFWADADFHGQLQRMRWCPPGSFSMGSPASEATWQTFSLEKRNGVTTT